LSAFQQEVVFRPEAKVQALWQGLWYVNAGGGEYRSSEDMRRYGFIAAGGGPAYSDPPRRLDVGAPIVAYQKGAGCVGHGTVTAPSVMVRDCVTTWCPLLDQTLTEPELAYDRDDPELAEYDCV
jgi:hypothetical protein